MRQLLHLSWANRGRPYAVLFRDASMGPQGWLRKLAYKKTFYNYISSIYLELLT